MTQHTPGPWTLEDRRRAALKNIRVISGIEEIAWMSHTHQRDDQGGFKGSSEDHAAADVVDATGLANARLIAAAPDLLAALKAVMNRVQERWIIGRELILPLDVTSQIEAAIAKATESPLSGERPQ